MSGRSPRREARQRAGEICRDAIATPAFPPDARLVLGEQIAADGIVRVEPLQRNAEDLRHVVSKQIDRVVSDGASGCGLFRRAHGGELLRHDTLRFDDAGTSPSSVDSSGGSTGTGKSSSGSTPNARARRTMVSYATPPT